MSFKINNSGVTGKFKTPEPKKGSMYFHYLTKHNTLKTFCVYLRNQKIVRDTKVIYIYIIYTYNHQ